MECVVGRHYEVPCVRTNRNSRKIKMWLPVVGEPHTDEDLGQPKLHQHIDMRFLTDGMLKLLFPEVKKPPHQIKNIHVIVLSEKTERRTMRLRCQRPQVIRQIAQFVWRKPIVGDGPATQAEAVATWACPLQDQFKDRSVITVDGCKVCPHRGMALSDGATVPGRPNVVECAGHGLTWNLTTGKLIAVAQVKFCGD